MYSYLQNVTKNAQFTLYFSGVGDQTQNRMTYNQQTPTVKISKDGGAIATAANAPVYIGAAGQIYADMWKVVLTADEMNADAILLNISWDDDAVAQAVTIYTGSVGGSSLTAEEVWEYATRTITDTDTGAGNLISMDDVINNDATIPSGHLTVRQAFELIIKRFNRTKNNPKL